MKLIELKCPKCKATISVNEELETAVCNYCGTQFKVEDENATKEERIIKALGKQQDKDRKYYASEEYEKKLDVETTANDKSFLGSLNRMIDKRRKFVTSEEYQKLQDKRNEDTKKTLKLIFGIMFPSMIVFCLLIFCLVSCSTNNLKSGNLTCHIDDKQYYLTFNLDEEIKCASCDDDMKKELNDSYNDKSSINNTKSNIETYFINKGGYCGYKATTSKN